MSPAIINDHITFKIGNTITQADLQKFANTLSTPSVTEVMRHILNRALYPSVFAEDTEELKALKEKYAALETEYAAYKQNSIEEYDKVSKEYDKLSEIADERTAEKTALEKKVSELEAAKTDTDERLNDINELTELGNKKVDALSARLLCATEFTVDELAIIDLLGRKILNLSDRKQIVWSCIYSVATFKMTKNDLNGK